MANVYKKRFPQNPVNLTNGKSIRFEDTGGGFGFFVTEDPIVISEFELCMKESRGGIQVATMEEYQEIIKKKLNSPTSSIQSAIREKQTAGIVTVPPVPIPQVTPVAVEGAVSAVVVDAKLVGPAPEPKVGKKPTK